MAIVCVRALVFPIGFVTDYQRNLSTTLIPFAFIEFHSSHICGCREDAYCIHLHAIITLCCACFHFNLVNFLEMLRCIQKRKYANRPFCREGKYEYENGLKRHTNNEDKTNLKLLLPIQQTPITSHLFSSTSSFSIVLTWINTVNPNSPFSLSLCQWIYNIHSLEWFRWHFKIFMWEFAKRKNNNNLFFPKDFYHYDLKNSPHSHVISI